MAKKITETKKATVAKKNVTVKKTSTAKKVSAVKKTNASKVVSGKSPALKKATVASKSVAKKATSVPKSTPVSKAAAPKKSKAPGRVISPAKVLKKSEVMSPKKKTALKAKVLGGKKTAPKMEKQLVKGAVVVKKAGIGRTLSANDNNASKASKPIPQTVQIICQALADKKAEDIKVFDVCGVSSVTDYIIVATGTSEPHLRALRVEIDRELSKCNIDLIGSSSDTASGWLVADAFDVMAHIFTKEMRDLYRIESLFKEAKLIKVSTK